MGTSIPDFIAKWAASGAAERANKDAFLIELCDVLDVPRPQVTTGDAEKDTYVFEKDAILQHEGGSTTTGKVDLFKADALILEADTLRVTSAQFLGIEVKRWAQMTSAGMHGAVVIIRLP